MTSSRNNNGGSWDMMGNGLKEKENELRLKQTLEYLIEVDASDPSTLAPEASMDSIFGQLEYTPQYQAALWISKYDKYRIWIPSTLDENEPLSGDYYPFLQRYSLAVLFFATGGEHHWLWKVNFLRGLHECAWLDKFAIQGYQNEFVFGVLCDGEPDLEEGEGEGGEDDVRRIVTGVSLPPMNNMWGTLPPEVRHLRHLKVFHIQHNPGVTGEIPFEYGWLKHLSALALINNNLSGKIPRTLAYLTKMQILRLEDNQFSGDTVNGDLDFLGEMKSLAKLTLDYNAKITGTIPDFISNLSKLQHLTLSNTNMYGTLPSSLSMLKDLKSLYLDDCAFEGSVDVISRMSNLTHVYLEDNMFNDTIDDTFFVDLENLVHLDISNCSWSGSVPGHLFNFSQLEVLDMSLNNLVGELPAEAISNVQESKLGFLSFHTNNITGPIPPSIGKLKNLSTLDLSSNEFSADIPSEIADLVDLDILFLGRNNFTGGPVPEWVRNLTQLTELSLKSASLTNEIPTWLGELTKLKLLDLGENKLTGTIPQSLGNLTQLMVLMLNKNDLKGELGLGQLEKLETLLIDENSLTGNTDAMCAHEITHFTADCFTGGSSVEIQCDCCTLCCFDENVTCNDSEWLGNHGGIWETGYNRVTWDFDDGFISPLLNYNYLQ